MLKEQVEDAVQVVAKEHGDKIAEAFREVAEELSDMSLANMTQQQVLRAALQRVELN